MEPANVALAVMLENFSVAPASITIAPQAAAVVTSLPVTVTVVPAGMVAVPPAAGQSKACACTAASAAARTISLKDFMATYSFPKECNAMNSTIRRESLQPVPRGRDGRDKRDRSRGV